MAEPKVDLKSVVYMGDFDQRELSPADLAKVDFVLGEEGLVFLKGQAQDLPDNLVDLLVSSPLFAVYYTHLDVYKRQNPFLLGAVQMTPCLRKHRLPISWTWVMVVLKERFTRAGELRPLTLLVL